ncbi:MAG: response regulator [Betaproteobacteria bacterium]
MSVTTPIVHLIDDDDAFRTAIGRVLQLAGYDVREYRSAGNFLLDTATRREPGCILLDLRMPGPSGLELHEALAAAEDALPVVFISGHGDVDTSVRAMKAGAVDFLTKPVDRDRLLAAVGSAVARDAKRRVQGARRQDLDARYATLAPRERDVFRLILAGKLNKQIAAALGIAERTVKAHRAQVMEKMRAASLAELVLLAAQLPWDSDMPAVE